jgi:hypothetical protein
MKSLLSLFALISFVWIAVFGFAVMNHDSGHGHTGCIATRVKGIECPSLIGTLDMVFLHMSVFEKFSSAVLSDYMVLILFLVLALVVSYFLSINHDLLPQLSANHLRWFNLELYKSPPKKELLHWFSLHENSPSVL